MTTTNTVPSAAPAKFVATITGGGTAAISNILKRGGASSWFLEGNIPYAKESLVEFLGAEPEKYVSEETANQLALKSYLRAIKLGASPREAGGLGATAVLGKPAGEREGRKHFAYVSVQRRSGLTSYRFDIEGFNTRTKEEDYLANKIDEIMTGEPFKTGSVAIKSVADHIGYTNLLLNDKRDFTLLTTDGLLLKGSTLGTRKVAVYSGSFNPFHDGHAEVIKKAIGKYDRIWLEISIKNVDKPEINLISLDDRILSITHGLTKHDLHDKVAGIILSNTPKFKDKLWQLGPNVDFLVGSDTAKRIVDTKYGDPQELIDISETYGTRFIVVRRPGHEFVIPKKYDTGVFEFVGGTGLNISSTELRKESHAH